MKFIYVSQKVETHIEALKKNGKAGTTLANKAKSIVKNKPAKKSSRMSEETDNMANDHELFKHLTDKDLRRVFSGLVQVAK